MSYFIKHPLYQLGCLPQPMFTKNRTKTYKPQTPRLKKKISFMCLYVYVYMCVCLLVCAPCICLAHRIQIMATDLLELELQAIVRQLVWVLGTIPGSSTRLTSVLDH